MWKTIKSISIYLCNKKGAFKASAFFGARESENHIKEFNEKYEVLGPLMFGLHDGQTEAPKIQAQKVVFSLFHYPVESENLLFLAST